MRKTLRAALAASIVLALIVPARAQSASPFEHPTRVGVQSGSPVVQLGTAAKRLLTPGDDVSTNTVLGAGATTTRTLADKAADVYDVMAYGAKCNASTDDTAALNAISAAIRATATPYTTRSARIQFPSNRKCLIRGTWNMTGLAAIGTSVSPSYLSCHAAGLPCIDALGSRFIEWDELQILGDQTDTPTIGLQIGRTGTASADLFRFDRPKITGYFTFTPFYNFASETNLYIDPLFQNSTVAANTFAAVFDGQDHWNISSQFVTQNATVDQCRSFNENTIIGGLFQSGGSPFWIAGAGRLQFFGSYASAGSTSPTQYGAQIFSSGCSIAQLRMGVHFETPNLTDTFFLTGTANPTIAGFEYAENYNEASNSIFKIDPNSSITKATITNGLVNVAAYAASPKVFDAPASWGGQIRVTGALSSLNVMQPVADLASSIAIGVGGNLKNTNSSAGGQNGIHNIAIGTNALQANTTGGLNTAIGSTALFSNTTGSSNMAFGFAALYSNFSGTQNVAVGVNASSGNTTGSSNTVIGKSALTVNQAGGQVTAIGHNAFQNANSTNTASRGVAIGDTAGGAVTTGDYNTLIGSYAGSNITSGNNNVIVGYNVQAPSATASNFFSLAGAVYGTIGTGNPVYIQGPLTAPKLTVAPAAAPGAGFVALYAVAGTNTGTCKIQAMAGTSTTPVTIQDNIGSGC